MTFKILSIDGGGIRGVYPAHILKCFEEKLGINLLESFDMIAGTSTGSIIAAGVACDIRATEIVNMYKEHGEDIFKKKKSRIPFKKLRNITQPLLESVYDCGSLYKVLKGVFNDSTLGQIAKPLILPATDVGNGGVHVFKSAYDPTFNRDRLVKVRDAVLASCSAPTYFDPHKVDEYLLSDGGLWANNPALVAVIDAQKRLGINYDDIQVVSIGTGHSKVAYGLKHKGDWGLATGWRHKEFISFMLSLQSQSALNYLKLHLKPEQILRIDFESDTDLPLDDVSEIDNLISLADKNFTYGSKEISNFVLGGNVS
ncbi:MULTISPECIES: CBASS cGAMP-activated phospholipase [Shewanella]|uniref:CBASS cGAMP-activated phospholipase n=1 Tax=Shewanella TaxID=22 RepID=UPI00005DEE49|nr:MULTISPECIES: CBASS cGAMP-activated phospholipase [Shewanella]ABK50565.1 Patatin [Shewanella sp. ANA-3]MBW0278529.1 patatin [Shewanella xiamenensis]MCS6119210.1 patatin-like phospholipase family protein [Shewanella baltica]MCU7962014.1 patatin-like phospholipase family protein [Shewanella sp. SW32]MCU7969946.1 patatin-like phospholipase family protein [Shewanella sp. SW29]